MWGCYSGAMENDPLSPFIKALHDLMNNAQPRQISSMDQYRSVSAERARELLAYYVLTCLNQEADQVDEATRYALKFALKIKSMSPSDYMGVTTAPAASRRALISGCASTALISLFNRSMIGCGVPRGAKNPAQRVKS